MAANDSVSIVPTSELKKLSWFKRLWWVGWVSSIAIGIIFAYQFGRIRGKYEEATQLSTQEDRLVAMEKTDEAIVNKLVEAWQGNKTLADALAAWSEYNKDRALLVHENATAKR
jgi:hypothetical protein